MSNQTQDKTYNGYTNYETWNVKLWIDNEQASQQYWLDRASDYIATSEADGIFTKEERAALDLMQELKDSFTDTMPELGASCYTDLLNSAMSEVNWHEIARDLISDTREINQ